MLKGTDIQEKRSRNLIDRASGAGGGRRAANGTTIISGKLRNWRVKETDRIARSLTTLRVMGAQVIGVERRPRDSWPGAAARRTPSPAWRPSHRHGVCHCRTFRRRRTIIQDAECVEFSYPGFKHALEDS